MLQLLENVGGSKHCAVYCVVCDVL